MTAKTTKCPECGTEIDVNELLYEQLESKAQESVAEQFAQQQDSLHKKHQELEARTRQLDEQINTSVQEQLAQERKTLDQEIRQEQAAVVEKLQTQLKEQADGLVQLNE
ncbi:MAG: hypothetical protein AAF197_00765, partial [Pseudomonadota bacterium]